MSKRAADHSEKKAHGVDRDIKAANLARLARIEGQVRGLARMVETDRYCPDILLQVDSTVEALRSVARELLRNHLRHCAKDALVSGDTKTSNDTIDELVDLFHRYRR